MRKSLFSKLTLNCYIAGVFFRYSAHRCHWLVHGHMTSNNGTVCRQNTLSGQHYEICDVKRETVHRYPRNVAVSRDQSVQLKMAWCCRWNLSALFKICFCFCFASYITNHLMTGPEENSVFCFRRISMFPETSSRKHWDSRKTKYAVLLGTSHSVNCYTRESTSMIDEEFDVDVNQIERDLLFQF